MSFPYRDVGQASQAAEQALREAVDDLHLKADRAWGQQDYRAHAIYCMAANRIVQLQHAEKELIIIKKGKRE